MRVVQPSLIIGYHGTDLSTAKKVINNSKNLIRSENKYDWLGNGIYFWENDQKRALEYIKEKFKREKSRKKPAVIGAAIDLGYCLNLLDRISIDEVEFSYKLLEEAAKAGNITLPTNKSYTEDGTSLLRYLDCLVIQTLHRIRHNTQKRKYETVRSAFVE